MIKLGFLNQYELVFNPYENTFQLIDTLWFVFAFILVFIFKNSMEKWKVLN